MTVTSVDGAVFRGNFDIVLDSGDHITGSFEPAACPAIVEQDTTAPSCQP